MGESLTARLTPQSAVWCLCGNYYKIPIIILYNNTHTLNRRVHYDEHN